MIRIVKGPEPRELLDWKRENQQSPQNLTYGGGGFPYQAVRAALISEQHFLCAYTMRGLRDAEQSHIEHVLPQSRNKPEETIDYRNMLACYPGPNQKTACLYGARVKADYDPEKSPFCSPLQASSPARFRFSADGKVAGCDEFAEATINVLQLNHPILVNDRKAVIRGRLHAGRRSLSAAAARRLADEIRRPDGTGRLVPYCEAIAQAALKFADREERKAQRLRLRTR